MKNDHCASTVALNEERKKRGESCLDDVVAVCFSKCELATSTGLGIWERRGWRCDDCGVRRVCVRTTQRVL